MSKDESTQPKKEEKKDEDKPQGTWGTNSGGSSSDYED